MEQQLEDREAEIRRMALVAETKVESAPESRFSEEEWEALREELAGKNRQVMGLKFDLEEAQMQVNNLSKSLLLYRNSSEEYEERLQAVLQQQEEVRREALNMEQAMNGHIEELQTEIARLNGRVEHEQRARSEEGEVQRLQQEVDAKDEELRELNKTLKDSLALVETLESKTRVQEQLVAQYEASEREQLGGQAENSEQMA